MRWIDRTNARVTHVWSRTDFLFPSCSILRLLNITFNVILSQNDKKFCPHFISYVIGWRDVETWSFIMGQFLIDRFSSVEICFLSRSGENWGKKSVLSKGMRNIHPPSPWVPHTETVIKKVIHPPVVDIWFIVTDKTTTKGESGLIRNGSHF